VFESRVARALQWDCLLASTRSQVTTEAAAQLLLARGVLRAHHLFELLVVALVHGLLITLRLLLLLTHAGEVDTAAVREVPLALTAGRERRAAG
jgi:hypothetical protein